MIKPTEFLNIIKTEITDEEIQDDERLGEYQNGLYVFYSCNLPELANKDWRMRVSSLLVVESRRIHKFKFEEVESVNQWKLTLRLAINE